MAGHRSHGAHGACQSGGGRYGELVFMITPDIEARQLGSHRTAALPLPVPAPCTIKLHDNQLTRNAQLAVWRFNLILTEPQAFGLKY
jgi:hypothetical protein